MKRCCCWWNSDRQGSLGIGGDMMRMPGRRALWGYRKPEIVRLLKLQEEHYQKLRDGSIRLGPDGDYGLQLDLRSVACGLFGLNKRITARFVRQRTHLLEDELRRLVEEPRPLNKAHKRLDEELDSKESRAPESEEPIEQAAPITVLETAAGESAPASSQRVLAFRRKGVPPEAASAAAHGYAAFSLSGSATPSIKAKAVGSGYWEDAAAYLESPDGTGGSIALAESMFPSSAAPYTETSVAVEPAPLVLQAPLPAQAAPTTEQPAAAAARREPASSSPAITEEVRRLRHRYIVGKLAGNDLYDRSGLLIVAKHATITEAAMEAAEREGKLAELIVHMVIPGLGE